MAEVDLADRESFRVWHHHVLRFADLDPVGHVNNVAYAAFFESGRVAFAEAAGVAGAGPGRTFMIVRLVIDYRAQLNFPGEVDIGTRVLRVGRSSCDFGQGLFRDGVCAATAEAVCVLVDLETNTSTPIPDGVRARLESLTGA